ncbi:unnamed protein product [Anisakis simplex]|uniref:Ku_N domain-containing protein n=1 Tax=Anisakis simplex TaxID=6269 RepID=A0A0M3KKM2_ANISI|nr:unnamed protein product [Anisakis simplex]
MENEEVGVARSAQIFRNFLYRYRDELSASVLVAGYDDDEGGQVNILPVHSLSFKCDLFQLR